VLRGAVLDRNRADAAAAAALRNAQPMSDNAYKVPIAKTLIRRALLRAGGIEAA
jgi:xanthine dehydrogenase YagS FAD-binding subunit